MVKMAKKTIHYRSWSWYQTEANKFHEEAVMRDIIPDGKYEILFVNITVNSDGAPGKVTYFAMAKNVDAEEPEISLGKMIGKPGIIIHWEPNMLAAAGTPTMDTVFYAFPEPLTFDENDKLNFCMKNVTGVTTTYVIDLAYRRI